MEREWQFVRVASLGIFICVVDVGAQLTIYINVKLDRVCFKVIPDNL